MMELISSLKERTIFRKTSIWLLNEGDSQFERSQGSGGIEIKGASLIFSVYLR